jgi:hypothetical protein
LAFSKFPKKEIAQKGFGFIENLERVPLLVQGRASFFSRPQFS